MKPMTEYHSYQMLCWCYQIFADGEGNGTPLQYSCLEYPWTEEPGGLQSTRSLGVGLNWATSLSLFTFMHWWRKWQPTPVLLPGESQGWGSWWAAIYGVTQSRTRLKRLSSSSSSSSYIFITKFKWTANILTLNSKFLVKSFSYISHKNTKWNIVRSFLFVWGKIKYQIVSQNEIPVVTISCIFYVSIIIFLKNFKCVFFHY